jgi:phosphohistidine phosphatase
MKTLYLIRHAKAVTRNLGLPDFERSLIPRGEKDAQNLARKLKTEGMAVDLMVSSPANRALLTAHIFANELGYPVQKIMLKDEIYDAISSRALLRVVRALDEQVNSVMLFGHNPAFDDFANYLINDFTETIPTCGVVGIEFQKHYWKNVSKGTGELKFFTFPLHKTKRATVSQTVQSDLEARLSEQTLNLLKTIDAATAEKFRDYIKGASAKLARKFILQMTAYTERPKP